MGHENSLFYDWRTNISMITKFTDFSVIFGVTLIVSYYFNHTPISIYLLALGAILSFYFISELQQFYVSWRTTPFWMEVWHLTLIWYISALVSEGAVSLLDGSLFLGRKHQIAWFFITWIVLIFYRSCVRKFLRRARMKGHNIRRVAIVGTGELAGELAARIRRNPWMGLQIEGFFDESTAIKDSVTESDVCRVSNLDKLIERARKKDFDRIYIALPITRQSCINDLVEKLSDTTCTVLYVPDVFTFELLSSRVDNLNGLPLINIYSTPMNGLNRVLKRGFDLVVSIVILFIIIIPMIAIAVAIKFTSKGPVFFKQTRYGIQGKPIKVWKFRSMTVMEDGNVITQAKPNDCRLTPIGRFLRCTSLDELPQFINVIQGTMSIVGPRPHAIAHNEEYRKLINGYMLRHMVKPGITGWAQINGWRGETDTLDKMEKRIQYDLEYIRNWSVFLDLRILLLTIVKGFYGKTAY